MLPRIRRPTWSSASKYDALVSAIEQLTEDDALFVTTEQMANGGATSD